MMIRSANLFLRSRGTHGRVRTKTGGMVVSTPSGSTAPVFMCNMGRAACTKRSVVSGTSYAAGYLTPVTGILGSGFNVIGNLVAAIRTTATARGAISNPSGGS